MPHPAVRRAAIRALKNLGHARAAAKADDAGPDRSRCRSPPRGDDGGVAQRRAVTRFPQCARNGSTCSTAPIPSGSRAASPRSCAISIHERLGLFYEATQFDQLADRLAPLVVARGLGSFMDYYYLLKYSDDDEEWAPGHGRAGRPGNLLLAGDRSAARGRRRRRAAAGEALRRTAAADLERAVRDRRRAADAGDAARRGRLVRSRCRSRCSAATPARRRSRERDQGRYGQRVVPQPAAGAAREVLRRRATISGPSSRSCSGASPTTSSTWSPKTRCAATRPRRSSSAGTCSSISPIRASAAPSASFAQAMPDPGVPVRRRLRVAAAPARGVRAAGDRRRVRVREGRSPALQPDSRYRSREAKGPAWIDVLRVLVVDDSAYVRKVVKEMLSRESVDRGGRHGPRRRRRARAGRAPASPTS